MVQTERVHEKTHKNDGKRILEDQLLPRGLTEQKVL